MDQHTGLEQQLTHAGLYLLNNQLAWGTSGNMSARIDADRMLITASGTHMGRLQSGDFVECSIESGEWAGGRKPSKEIPMHRGVYLERPDAKIVLHSSPFYTTLFACSDEPILSELYIETMYYLEDVAYVDYYHPGTKELGEAVRRESARANIVMMRNHGVIVFDDNLSDALMRLETLEMACRMIVTAKSAGIPLKRIAPETVHDFLHNGNYKPRKKKD